MQEAQGIENRMGCLPEGFEHGRERGFRSARALRMAAHAVDHHQEHGLIRGRHRDSILIFLAVADQAHVRGFDLQCRLLDLVRLRLLKIMADFSDDPHDS